MHWIKKFIILIIIIGFFFVGFTQDIFITDTTMYESQILGSCGSTILLSMLSTIGVHYDLYWFHTEYLGQPTNYYDITQFKSFHELAALIEEIDTIITNDLTIIDNELINNRPVGLYLTAQLYGQTYGHAVLIYGKDNNGYYVHDPNQYNKFYYYLTNTEIQEILDHYNKIWILKEPTRHN